ncbi:MAG: ABC transporter permease [Proteobacteria bacterium]|jgi:putative spermidine/putrescine transport system permease protein|nr:ABC transporter permease [Methylibium sp.]MCH8857326.1 ABC transporter permease [Pseudomonadota bacterium]|mmetsp:Transcript_66505/g.156996  ORF Transcript_66505/g.156996 Transcript_66505/m.156996 type:complete len:276 (-) Transcript_66505:202-1029(-)
MSLTPARAWLAAGPMLLLLAGALLLPFGWRSLALLQACLGGAECALHELWDDRFYLDAIARTVALSAASTALGLVLGLGAALHLVAHPRWDKPVAVLAGLGANFAGVPLALALTLLLGSQGVLTTLARQAGLLQGWDLASDAGLLLAFTAFQVPLALVLLAAPVKLLDPALAEAAATLGASPARFWRRVGLPLLAPSLVEAASLLFANAAAAYATPFALAGTASPVLAVRIAAAVSGDIFSQPELATALSLVMALLLLAVIAGGRWWSARLRRLA